MDLLEMSNADPNSHWYYISKSLQVNRKILKYSVKPSRVAEIGAGSSFFTKRLAKFNSDAIFYCIDTGYKINRVEGNIYYQSSLEVKVDTMLMIDVLEHIDEQVEFLSLYREFLSAGDYLYITVPAFNFLWSNHDVYLKHFRKYTRKSLRTVLETSNFEVVEISYIFNSVLPAVFLYRKFVKRNNSAVGSDMRDFSFIINLLLLIVCRLDRFLPLQKIFGLSILCVCRKK